MAINDAKKKALNAFAEVASEYCRLIESLMNARSPRLYQELEELLANLCVAILPVQIEVARGNDDSFKPFQLTPEDRQHISQTVANVVKPESDALMQRHAGHEEDITRALMLFTDLAELHSDLHDGLVLWQSELPESRSQAAWDWRWGFENHWGDHLIRAMLTVHEARYVLFAN